jgi:mono/diheme cytochrome c family protein
MRNTMRPKFLFSIIGFVAVFAVILAMLTIGFIPLSADANINPQAGVQHVTVEPVEVQVDAGAFIPTAEPLASQVTPSQNDPSDGLSLLKSRCARCHTTQSLIQIKKSNAEWEKALANMEAMGVHLDESEKVILIDYIATADTP